MESTPRILSKPETGLQRSEVNRLLPPGDQEDFFPDCLEAELAEAKNARGPISNSGGARIGPDDSPGREERLGQGLAEAESCLSFLEVAPLELLF